MYNTIISMYALIMLSFYFLTITMAIIFGK